MSISSNEIIQYGVPYIMIFTKYRKYVRDSMIQRYKIYKIEDIEASQTFTHLKSSI